ncbi:MAG: 16S rRNA (cytidine(1402)-2'-O)-methyltransferase [Zoogloeaceae bacterium]|jgi:16S rRNA (cytidine1402-2'-O)-methyltransferase|nr:16S rRNA (cytidine(1402)-2'-O)-methyltransferase [Zoogloeaceae bacterium]
MTEKRLAPLYVVPTPLGNLGDLSARQRDILTCVDWIAAEDTRHCALLFQHLKIPGNKCFAAHAHNEQAIAERIVVRLSAGESGALISDAGTPAISDPGARIVARVRAAGGVVIPLPGPCAAVTAISASGLPDAHWLFYGFLPPKSGQRRTALVALQAFPHALVFYEAPHRVTASVADMAVILGEQRTLVLARELTKRFEQIHALPLGEARAWLEADAQRQKGEFVLIVSGARVARETAEADRILRLLLEEMPTKQAARLAAAITDIPRNTLYERALALQSRKQQTPS